MEDVMKEIMLEMGADLQVYLFFGFLILFIVMERLVPRRNPVEPQGKRWRTNAALSVLAIALLPVLPVSFITAALWAEVNNFGLLNFAGIDLPDVLLVVITFLLRGFISFFTHFLNHKIPLLWRIHRVHHLDTELDVSSTVRFHPLEMPISMVVGLPLVMLFGLSPWVLLLYELFDATVTVFSHANIRIPASINRILRYIIVTPDLHKVHHSSFMPETNSNFSAVFPIWDILFGTFRTTTIEPLESMKLGLDEIRDPEASGFWWLLASPFLSQKVEQTELEALP
jgi:sterol desaturase/sphingolipid hydroxylase (fatty acid hydroxylase superfamily)